MPDREKVIKGLEYHLKELSIGKTCFECPYWGDNPCETQLIADALVLLKEQEAVEPKQVYLYGKEDWYGLVCVCTDCKAEWMSDKADTHFCPKCGRPVLWEGR